MLTIMRISFIKPENKRLGRLVSFVEIENCEYTENLTFSLKISTKAMEML